MGFNGAWVWALDAYAENVPEAYSSATLNLPATSLVALAAVNAVGFGESTGSFDYGAVATINSYQQSGSPNPIYTNSPAGVLAANDVVNITFWLETWNFTQYPGASVWGSFMVIGID